MKTRVFNSLAVALLFLAPVANAGVGIYGSHWNAGNFEGGWGVGLKLGQRILPMITVEARGGAIEFDEQRTTAVPLELGGSAEFMSLYCTLGLGYYLWSVDDARASNEFGGFAELGAQFTFAGLGVFAGAKYTINKTTIHDTEHNTEGLGANAGFLLNW